MYYFHWINYNKESNTFLCDLAEQEDGRECSNYKKYEKWPSVSFFHPSDFWCSEYFHLECKSAFQQRGLWLNLASSWVKFQPNLKVFSAFSLSLSLSSVFSLIKSKDLMNYAFFGWGTLCHFCTCFRSRWISRMFLSLFLKMKNILKIYFCLVYEGRKVIDIQYCIYALNFWIYSSLPYLFKDISVIF